MSRTTEPILGGDRERQFHCRRFYNEGVIFNFGGCGIGVCFDAAINFHPSLNLMPQLHSPRSAILGQRTLRHHSCLPVLLPSRCTGRHLYIANEIIQTCHSPVIRNRKTWKLLFTSSPRSSQKLEFSVTADDEEAQRLDSALFRL